MYNTILLFISALFLFNASLPGSPSFLPLWLLLPVTALFFVGFYFVAKALFVYFLRRRIDYQKAELWLSLFALLLFELLLICCQPGYYLAAMPIVGSVSALQSTGGLAIFFTLLGVVWLAGREFASQSLTPKELLLSNLQANLPVVLPWLLITLLYDIINLQPFTLLRSFADSPYGFVALALLALLILPGIIRRIWGCQRLPDGEQREMLEELCARLDFSAEIYLWPLHQGRAITAAIVGLVPGFRYILITPALLEVMDEEEIKAVVAHEAGHVKRGHLLLSVLLIAGFSVAINAVLEPIELYLQQLDFLQDVLSMLGFSHNAAIALIVSAPALVIMLLFFRFVFGYFIRNFEREADLYSFSAMRSAAPLISAFEKIAAYSADSNEKEKKNWHHFGLGERIQCLQSAEQQPSLVKEHNKKLLFSLAGYFLLMAFFFFPGSREEVPSIQQKSLAQLTPSDQALVQKKGVALLSSHQKAAWYRQLGDILIGKKKERDGLLSYEKSLQLDPSNPTTLNNLAWLLVASEDLALRNPERALELAIEATQWHQNGFFYDTLAAVYWANGMTSEALKAEEKAIALDPGRRDYYQAQAWKFRTRSYQNMPNWKEAGVGDIPKIELPADSNNKEK